MSVLSALLEDFKAACLADDIYRVETLDISFHKYFIDKYEDKHLLDLWKNIINRMMFRYSRLKNLMDVYTEHNEILESIKKGDKAKAKELIKQNIQ